MVLLDGVTVSRYEAEARLKLTCSRSSRASRASKATALRRYALLAGSLRETDLYSTQCTHTTRPLTEIGRSSTFSSQPTGSSPLSRQRTSTIAMRALQDPSKDSFGARQV